jgi:predicted outer membrane protein
MGHRSFITVAVLALIFLCGPAFAQAQQKKEPAPKEKPAATAPASKASSTVEDVKTWTNKQWNSAQREWAKDKKKWTDCRKQSTDKKLSGKDSWSFLYTCMAA